MLHLPFLQAPIAFDPDHVRFVSSQLSGCLGDVKLSCKEFILACEPPVRDFVLCLIIWTFCRLMQGSGPLEGRG